MDDRRLDQLSVDMLKLTSCVDLHSIANGLIYLSSAPTILSIERKWNAYGDDSRCNPTKMSFFSNLWHRVYASILDNRNKLTATGGLLLGIVLTLGFKDFYPDLEQTFRQRLRRVRGQDFSRPLPVQPDYVRLEDHTRRKSSMLPPDAAGRRHTQEHEVPVGIEGLIGDTPLIKLKSLSEATGCEIFAKAEYLNGAGNSPKDRVALSMINHAEDEGLIKPDRGDTIYEGTVGSTGISLAAVCRARGYKAYMYVATRLHSQCMSSKLSQMYAR